MKTFEKLLKMTPLKALFTLGMPSVLRALIDELNSVIDAVFMGQYFGSQAVASMSIIFPFMLLLISIGTIFSAGAMILIGKSLGAKDVKKANQTFMNTVVLTFITGCIVGIFSYVMIPHILSMFEISQATREFSQIYMEIISLGMPIMLISTLLNEMLYTEGHSKISLYLAVFQLLANVIMNFVFIGILNLSVMSIAIATLVSMILQIFFMVKYIQSDKVALKIDFSYVHLEWSFIKKVVPLGMPSFMTMILLSITLAFESKVISSFGPDALSVQAITAYIFSATGSVASGILSAAVVLMSYCVGARDYSRFKNLLKQSLVLVSLSALILNLPMILNSNGLVAIFTDSTSVMASARIPALVYGYTATFIFTTNVFLYVMTLVEMENTSTIIFTLQQLILFMPLLLILKNFGFNLAVSAQPISEVIGGIITLCLLPKLYKNISNVFHEKKISENLG
ncbi:hypothetical protein EZV73_05895 [Acidaminobacter sp. JC074]|uniref:MATE family efflux transporter n=1 Tax=Acidaminobacter sp. JC074 TaxID=2530199 RepID=UPI001F10CEC7|nr:MATE family efflux transporter [Acidaminobacter sp. JC074]MCH4887091.1 hypothetical protein [Acidaminobacter sp. JC074]